MSDLKIWFLKSPNVDDSRDMLFASKKWKLKKTFVFSHNLILGDGKSPFLDMEHFWESLYGI